IVLHPPRFRTVPPSVCMTASAAPSGANAVRICATVAAACNPICWEIPEPINRPLAAKIPDPLAVIAAMSSAAASRNAKWTATPSDPSACDR
ncbi:hypothetical protein M5D96_008500, partial [Drosophila gunungcola]